jgi:hypothetical protein
MRIETEWRTMGNATIEDNQLESPEIIPVADHDRSRIAVAWFAFANSISVSTSAGVKNSGLQSSQLAAGAAWFGNCPASRRHYLRRRHANNSGGNDIPGKSAQQDRNNERPEDLESR